LFSYHSVYTIINFYITYIRARSLTHTHTHFFEHFSFISRDLYHRVQWNRKRNTRNKCDKNEWFSFCFLCSIRIVLYL